MLYLNTLNLPVYKTYESNELLTCPSLGKFRLGNNVKQCRYFLYIYDLILL